MIYRSQVLQYSFKKELKLCSKVKNFPFLIRLSENSKDTARRIGILMDFANRIPELNLKTNVEEKRLILNTIIESMTYNEDTNRLSVTLILTYSVKQQI